MRTIIEYIIIFCSAYMLGVAIAYGDTHGISVGVILLGMVGIQTGIRWEKDGKT